MEQSREEEQRLARPRLIGRRRGNTNQANQDSQGSDVAFASPLVQSFSFTQQKDRS